MGKGGRVYEKKDRIPDSNIVIGNFLYIPYASKTGKRGRKLEHAIVVYHVF